MYAFAVGQTLSWLSCKYFLDVTNIFTRTIFVQNGAPELTDVDGLDYLRFFAFMGSFNTIVFFFPETKKF